MQDNLSFKGDFMIFGIGEGKIDLILDTLNFSYNDTIKGKLKLDLPKPTKAKELRIELFAVKSVQESRRDPKTGQTRFKTTDRVIYNFKLSLGGEQEYSTKEYDFEIKTPPPPAQGTQPVSGWVSDAVNVLSMLGAVSPVKWYLNASLSKQMAFDISKKIQITVQ